MNLLPESHTDYVFAIKPEPATFTILLALVAAVAFIVVRRRSRKPRR